MDVCVVGAGAVGGMIAARLSRAQERLCVLETGEPLAAIRSRGLRLIEPAGGETRVENLLASSDPMELGAQDVVLLAVKAYAIPGLAKALRPLRRDGPGTRARSVALRADPLLLPIGAQPFSGLRRNR